MSFFLSKAKREEERLFLDRLVQRHYNADKAFDNVSFFSGTQQEYEGVFGPVRIIIPEGRDLNVHFWLSTIAWQYEASLQDRYRKLSGIPPNKQTWRLHRNLYTLTQKEQLASQKPIALIQDTIYEIAALEDFPSTYTRITRKGLLVAKADAHT